MFLDVVFEHLLHPLGQLLSYVENHLLFRYLVRSYILAQVDLLGFKEVSEVVVLFVKHIQLHAHYFGSHHFVARVFEESDRLSSFLINLYLVKLFIRIKKYGFTHDLFTCLIFFERLIITD